MKKQVNKKPATKKINAIENECIELQLTSFSEQQKISNPYVIYIENNFKIKQKAILFGDAVFGYEKNFGSDEGIKITTSGKSYAHLLKQSAHSPFEIGKWRIQTTNIENLHQEMVVNCVDADGLEVKSKVNLAIMKDAYQYQSDIIDISKIKYVNHNVYFEIELQSRTEMCISLFPISVYNNTIERHSAQEQKAPRLSGNNAVPVIIQAVSKMKLGSKKPLATKKKVISKKK